MCTTKRMFEIVVMIWLCCFLVGQTTTQESCKGNTSPCACEAISNVTTNRTLIRIDCSGPPLLTELPSIPRHTVILDFSNNLLKPDSIQDLCSYGFLEDVNLARNQLLYIPDQAFKKCYITKSLNLTGNAFDVISQVSMNGLEVTQAIYGLSARRFSHDCLTHLKALKVLEMTFFQTDIPATMFGGLENLKKLHIELPQTMIFPDSIFTPLKLHLQELSIIAPVVKNVPENLLTDFKDLQSFEINFQSLDQLSYDFFHSSALSMSLRNLSVNGIRRLSKETFNDLTGLKYLRIYKVEELPPGLFKDFHNLEYLDLSESHVAQLPPGWFSELRNLRFLSLERTGLKTLRRTDLVGMTSLINLDISDNVIRGLDDNLFFDISATVKEIDISHNSLKVVPAELFFEQSTLQKLYLNNNSISLIHGDAFRQLPALEELFLQHNKLFQLPPSFFIANTRLRLVDLASNAFITLPDQLFAANSALTKLNIADNHFRNLAESIKSDIPFLRELNVDHNFLSCDCDLYKVRILLKNAAILGNCQKGEEGDLYNIEEYLSWAAKVECLQLKTTDIVISNNFWFPKVSDTYSSIQTVETISGNEAIHRTPSISFVLESDLSGSTIYSSIVDTPTQTEFSTSSSTVNSTEYGQTILAESEIWDLLKVSKSVTLSSFDLDKSDWPDFRRKPVPVLTEEPLDTTNSVLTAISPTAVITTSIEWNESFQTTKMNSSHGNKTDELIIHTVFKQNDVIDDANITFRPPPEISKELSPGDQKTSYFYLTLALLISVTLICAIVLGFVYHKKRRSNIYEVSTTDYDISMYLNGQQSEVSSSLPQIKEVPSIQIESVDDDDNVDVQTYPAHILPNT